MSLIQNFSGDDGTKESLLYRNIDMKTSLFQTEFEKQLSLLPKSLALVKKFIYYDLLPNLERRIEQLERIKETPNYDEKILIIKQQNFWMLPQITCIDSFNTHNIKQMKTNKICLGTINGTIIIYDIESYRIVLEKSFTPGKRIEVISSSSVRYFDTYLSRIASVSRGDPNIYIFSFNHTFNVINHEFIISLYTPLNLNQPDIPISSLIYEMKFSPDTFYLAASDYAGGIRLYRFNDIPQNLKEMVDQKSDTKKDSFNNPFAFGAKKEEKQTIPQLNNKNDKKEDAGLTYMLINHYKFKEIENFSILKKDEIILDQKDKKNADKSKSQVIPQTTSKNDKGKGPIQVVPTEPIYEIKPVLEGNIDKTPVSMYPSKYPFFSFSQKRLIIDEKSNNNFISYLVTKGFYYSFYGSKNIKYVSLYPLINDKMKNSFKIYKSKNVILATTEESLSMANSKAKKEKEFVTFLKGRIDALNINVNSNLLNNNQSNLLDKIKTLEEFSFDLLYPLTCLALQKSYQTSNYLGVGLKQGSIHVFDLDLQSDKHLFKTLKFEVSQISIDESYLLGCSVDGQVHIYDLVSGNCTYQCYHNPYQNFPILSILPFFSLLSLVIDHSQRISVYNLKEMNKICKINLRSEEERFKLTNITNLLIDYNQEYMIFVVEKDKSEFINYTVLDLINFQSENEKGVMKEYNNIEPFNIIRSTLKEKLPISKNSYISFLKIKDLIIKCYPQLAFHIKKGLSIKKLMLRYEISNMPMSEEKRSMAGNMFLNNLTQGLSKPKKSKSESKKNNQLNSVKEKEEEIKRNPSKLEENINIILETMSSKDDKNSTQGEKNLIPHQKEVNKTAAVVSAPNYLRINNAKYLSSQKKDIFYHAFTSIRERHQYKEHRMQNIQSRFEKISNELKLPLINSKSPLPFRSNK